jgi:hypothetical protein
MDICPRLYVVSGKKRRGPLVFKEENKLMLTYS